MRKLIVMISLGLSILFAVALANAADEKTVTEETTKSSRMSTDQQPGTAAESALPDHKANQRADQKPDQPSLMGKSSDQRTMTSPDVCRDQAGNEFRRNEKGYNTCLKALEKSSKSSDQSTTQSAAPSGKEPVDQAGGQSAEESNTKY